MKLTTKTLIIANNRSAWSVVAVSVTRDKGRVWDDSGRFVTPPSITRVRDRRIARFACLEEAVASVAALVRKAQPDSIIYVPSTHRGEIALILALDEFKVQVRKAISEAELEEKPRSAYAQAWLLARRAWFNDNVPELGTWYVRD